MATLGSTPIMREILGSGSRGSNSSITRRLRRLKINAKEKPEIMDAEFQRLRRDIQNDLGGEDRLSAIEVKLVDAFAGNAVAYDFVNAKLIEEKRIEKFRNLVELGATLTTTMVRVAQRLGTKRVSKTIPTMDEFLLSRGHRPLDSPVIENDDKDANDSDENVIAEKTPVVIIENDE